MKKAMTRIGMAVFAMAGLLLLMGAAGSVDYALDVGREVPSVWTTIGRAAGGFGCFLASYFFWMIGG